MYEIIKYEIIKFEDGSKYIVVGMKSNEDSGSCAYDRTYTLLPYTKEKEVVVEIRKYPNNKHLDKHVKGTIQYKVSGTTTLPFKETKKYCYEYVGSTINISSSYEILERIVLKRVKKEGK